MTALSADLPGVGCPRVYSAAWHVLLRMLSRRNDAVLGRAALEVLSHGATLGEEAVVVCYAVLG